MSREEVSKLPKEILDFGYPVQIYDGFYLGPKSMEDLDGSEMFNHSCSPNAGVRGQNVLVARRHILFGEEICFDYETTDTEDMYFECKCKSSNCRGMIDGNSWKKLEFQIQNEGYLSWYILDKINKLNRIAQTDSTKSEYLTS